MTDTNIEGTPNIDALNKQFMAEWPKRCESDEVVKFLREQLINVARTKEGRNKDEVNDELITIEELITVRESEIKEQVLKEMEPK